MSENLESLKIFGTKYFKEQLFKPPPEVIEDVKYSKNHLQVGRKLDGSIYTLDLTEACRMLFIGATRCMPKGTLINTPDGHKLIEDCKEVYSFNTKTRSLEKKSCKAVNSGKIKVVQVYILGGGMYECSAEHEWLVYRNNKFKVVETRDLKQKDHLLNPRFRKKIRVSKVVFTNDVKEMYDLTVEDNANFELADGTITHNSGKTFFLRSIGDRLVQTDRDVIFLSDVKNEFHCVVVTQKVMTNNGIKMIKDLDEGKDKVLTYNFNRKKNEFKNFKKTPIRNDKVFEIEMQDGSVIKCTPEHRLFRKDGSEVRVKDVKEGEEVFSKKLSL